MLYVNCTPDQVKSAAEMDVTTAVTLLEDVVMQAEITAEDNDDESCQETYDDDVSGLQLVVDCVRDQDLDTALRFAAGLNSVVRDMIPADVLLFIGATVWS